MMNVVGVIHPGVLSTMIDFGTTVCIMTFDKRNRATASVDLSLSHIGYAHAGDQLFILTQINRIGRSLAYSEATVYDQSGFKLAYGRHLKSLLDVQYVLEDGKYFFPKKY